MGASANRSKVTRKLENNRREPLPKSLETVRTRSKPIPKDTAEFENTGAN